MLSATTVSVALAFVPPMSTAPTRPRPRWSVAGISAQGVGVDRWVAGQQGHRLRRATASPGGASSELSGWGVAARQVGGDPAGAAGGVADQVVALRSEYAKGVGTEAGQVSGRVSGNDRAALRHRAVR